MDAVVHRRKFGFSLVELLVVIAIIGILAALLLPALTRSKQRALRIECIGNLKEQGTAFHLFTHDHNSRFPMQTSTNDGGSLEYAQSGMRLDQFYFSYRHFQSLSRELVSPKLVFCPSDTERDPAATFEALQNSNISYFVNVTAIYGRSDSALSGDRNITNNFSPSSTLVRGTYGLRWTRELHFYKGNVLYGDAHVEQLNNLRFDIPDAQAANTYLAVPTVPPASSPPGPQPADTSQSSSGEGSGSSSTDSRSDKSAASKAPAPPVKPPAPSAAKTGASGAGTVETIASAPEVGPTPPPERVISNPPPPKVTSPGPVVEDPEEETPLQWIFKNLRMLVAKMSWWMLLLILVLAAVTLYLYARQRLSRKGRSARK